MPEQLFSDRERAIISGDTQKMDPGHPDYNTPENLSRRRVERMTLAVTQLTNDFTVTEEADLKKLAETVDGFTLDQLEDFIDQVRQAKQT